MESINQHCISGYIGGYLKVPGMELSEVPYINRFESGSQLVLLSIGSNQSRKSGDKWIKETIWRKVEFWGNDAAFLGEYSQKGQFIVIGYEEYPNSWTDKTTGEVRYGIKLRATNFSLPKMTVSPTTTTTTEVDYDPEAAPAPTPAPAPKSKKSKSTTTPESNGHADPDLSEIPY